MGLIELLIAMVVLNIGLFAVVSVFSGATTAVGRAATISSATAVADRQMEIYRSLENCAIWLDTASFPAKGSGSAYEADTKSYMDTNMADPTTGAPLPATPVAFLDKSSGATALAGAQWATNATTSVSTASWSGDIATSCTPSASTPPTTPISAIQPTQTVPGPDGTLFPVYTYIILTQQVIPVVAPATAPTYGSWEKQVTIVVRDPRNSAKILVRETSLFNPLSG